MSGAFLELQRRRVRESIVAEGAHPVPDERSVDAGQRALRVGAESRARGDCLVVLLSGGASAMLALPAEGVTLGDKAAVTRLLLASGLPIAEMNALRKHLSAIKGGQLAAAAGRSITYAISDVHAPVEDDPAVIGSGPTVADGATFADAMRVLHALPRSGLPMTVRDAVSRRLDRGVRGEIPETPKPGDPRLAVADFVLAGSRRDAMDAASTEAARLGYRVVRVDRPTLGEARDAAQRFITSAESVASSESASVRSVASAFRRKGSARRICVIASGETTVKVAPESRGLGGRNQEFALAASRRLADLGACLLASAGTDGVDGPTNAAGAYADSTTTERARAMGLDVDAALHAHDSYSFFQRLGDLIVTGPTGTNVGDLQILLLT